MNPRQGVIGEIAKVIYRPNHGPDVIGIDADLLLTRLLFFEEFVLQSVHLGELPYLIKLFGIEGFQQLLASGILKISCETFGIITDVHMNGRRQLPLLQYEQALVSGADRSGQFQKDIKCLNRVSGLSGTAREAASESVWTRLVRPGEGFGTDLLAQVRTDLRSNHRLLEVSTNLSLKETLGSSTSFEVKSEEVKTGVFRIVSNLGAIAGYTEEKEHELFSKVITAVCNLEQRVANMVAYSALSEFREEEAKLLFGKIGGLLAPVNPQTVEQGFARVLSFTDIPKLMTVRKISVERLIRVRDSDECMAFRSWLHKVPSMTDQELDGMLRGLRAKVGMFFNSPVGKTVRVATNVGLSLIPGATIAASAIEGAADTFLVDKLLPNPGILSFLYETCPSLFQSR